MFHLHLRASHTQMPTMSHIRRLSFDVLVLWTAVFVTANSPANGGEATKKKPAQGHENAATIMIDAAYAALAGKNDEAEACYRKVLELPETRQDPRNVMRMTFLLAKAMAAQTDRQEDVIDLLDSTMGGLRGKVKADDEDLAALHDLLLSQLFWRAWALTVNPDAEKSDYARAVKLSQRWQELALEDKESALWMLAFAKLRHGESKEALELMKHAIAKGFGEMWHGQWFIMAMIELANGNQQAARDWHTLGCRWMMVTDNSWQPCQAMRKQSADATGLSEEYPPAGVSETECQESVKRLVAAYPNVPRILAFEAARLASQKQWKEAIALYRKAENLDPKNFRLAEEQTALLLYSNKKPAARTGACRRLIKAWSDAENAYSRVDAVMLASYVADADLDRKQLLEVVEKAIKEREEVETFFKIGHGVALYHCGEYEEALASFAEVVPADQEPRNRNILLFQAMAHYKLGHVEKAQQLLEKARQLIAQQLPSPDGPQMVWRERPTEWCMAQLALEQAEALIDK